MVSMVKWISKKQEIAENKNPFHLPINPKFLQSGDDFVFYAHALWTGKVAPEWRVLKTLSLVLTMTP